MEREHGQDRTTAATLSAEDVSAWLRAHPDFLLQHAELLHDLLPPRAGHGGGNVVDLQSVMVERLRGDLAQERERHRELVAASRAHLKGQNRIHAAVLSLLDARSFEQFIQTITTDLAVLLDLDMACLLVESNSRDIPHVHSSGVRIVMPGSVQRWVGTRDILFEATLFGDREIFGSGAGLVRSQALIRLQISHGAPTGLLALGSRDPDMFQSGQSTELAGFLARVVERCIRTWLDLPA